MERGRNAGLTGLIDFPGIGASGAKFQVLVLAFKRSIETGVISRAGRGDGAWTDDRPLTSSGNLIVSFRVGASAYMPDRWNGQRGTVRIQHDTGKYEECAIMVKHAEVRHDEKAQDCWLGTLGCVVTDTPILVGFGTQPSATDPDLHDKELWSGLAKTVDPDSIADGATQHFDLYPISDDDTSEVSKIAAFIAGAIAPIDGLKLRPVVLSRTDSKGCRLAIQWARRSTGEDIERAGTYATYHVTSAGEETRTTVLSTAYSANELALQIFTANKADVQFERVHVRKLHGSKAVQTLTYRAAFQIVTAHITGGKLPARARFNPATGKVEAFFNAIYQRGSNLWYVELVRSVMDQVNIVFSLRRKVSGTTLPLHAELIGTRNNADFLGLPTGTVTYLGAQPTANIAIAPPRVSDMVWTFRASSLGMIDESEIATGFFLTTEDLSSVNRGWNPVEKLGWTANLLPDADYNVFLS